MNTQLSYDIFNRIIREQTAIIGPLAQQLARNVQGIHLKNDDTVDVIEGDSVIVLHDLITTYSQLFGQASIEICKDAVHSISPPIPPEMLPEELR
jgi:hypothetical protein